MTAAESIFLYRFRWPTGPGDKQTAVWVAYGPEVETYPVSRRVADMLAVRYGMSRYHDDHLAMRVDVEPATAAGWRAAAEAYFTALRAADNEWSHTQHRFSLFRSPQTVKVQAKARYATAAAVAEAAYEPHRAAAARALDEAYAPIRAFQRAKETAYAMPAWTFDKRGRTAHVRPKAGGLTHDQLLDQILKQRDITEFEWDPAAVVRAEELLGKGRFDEWWCEWAGHWNYRLTPPSEGRGSRGGPSSNYWSPGSF